jgi:hypothetical protein
MMRELKTCKDPSGSFQESFPVTSLTLHSVYLVLLEIVVNNTIHKDYEEFLGKMIWHIATLLDGLIFKWQNIIQPIEILQKYDIAYCLENLKGGKDYSKFE